MVNPEVFACHLVFRGCKNLPHFCYVKSFWPVVPFNVIRFVWHWKLSIFCWTMTQIDVWCQKLSKLRNAGSICCINLYTRPIHLAKFLFLVSQWPPERRLHVQYMIHDELKFFRIASWLLLRVGDSDADLLKLARQIIREGPGPRGRQWKAFLWASPESFWRTFPSFPNISHEHFEEIKHTILKTNITELKNGGLEDDIHFQVPC